MRNLLVIFLLAASAGAEAGTHSFVCRMSGRLGRPIRFEFGSHTHPKIDIRTFTVSMRTEEDRWRTMWAISGGHRLMQAMEYGVTPPGFTTMIKPEKLAPGRVYAASASDGRGGSSRVTFGFDKDGTMIFPDSFDD